MVSESDTDTVKAWLGQALGAEPQRAIRKKGLAQHCGVTIQAVDGWIRTGRITKRNLQLAGQFLGVFPAFVAATVVAMENTATYAASSWPFKLVPQPEITALSKKRLDRLDRLIRERLDEWAEDDAAAKRRTAA